MIQRSQDLRREEQPNKGSQQATKKPYARPQLVKHGSVETLTQTPIGPSCPIPV